MGRKSKASGDVREIAPEEVIRLERKLEDMQRGRLVELFCLPLPHDAVSEDGRVSRDVARDWLAEDAPLWVFMLLKALEFDDGRTREAFGMLGIDVRNMMEACAKIAGDDPDGFFVVRRSPNANDEGSLVLTARIVASFADAIENGVGGFVSCYTALAEDLERRLAALRAAA